MSRRPPASDDTEHGVLRRWSKRKLRSGSDAATRSPSVQDQSEPPGDSGGQTLPPTEEPTRETGREERIKTDDDMPGLDSINEGSDLSDFFSPGVSEQLRNQALRRLFRTSKFNVTDGLDDYNQDFRNFELLGDMVTSDMRHRMERDEQRRKEAAERDEEASPEEAAAAEAGEGADRDAEERDQPGEDEPSGGDEDQTETAGDTPSQTRT